MYQYNRALQLNPPLIKKGSNWNKNKIKFAPNVIIDLGSDPNADVIPLKIDTTALANFPNNYGLMKSQLINLLASPDTSISAEVGNPGFSKTPAGVQQMQANISVDDNYVRKQFETAYERWSETAINLYFAERTGVEELQLDKETAEALKKLANEGKFDLSLLSEDNKIRLDYSTATEKLRFEVDASTSRMQDEIKQLQSLTGIVDLLNKSQFLQRIVPPDKQLQLWNALVTNSGVEDPEDLTIDDEEMEMMRQQAAAEAQMQEQLSTQPQMTGQQPQEPMQPQAPAPPQVQPTLTPEDQQLIQQLQQLGANEQVIGQALAMLHNGVDPQQIIQMVIQSLQGAQYG